MHPLASLSGLLTLLAAFVSNAAAVDPAPRQMDFFESNVRPLLVKRCLECHGTRKQEGGLRLDSRAAILKGGASGEPAILPGNTQDSLLLTAVRRESFAMPPDSPLAESEIRILTEWIEHGAPWPTNMAKIRRTEADHISDEDRAWWAFQPLASVTVPDGDDDRWSHHAIDRFVLARLAQDGIRPAAAAADVLTLRRRAAYALTGLPPAADTPEETFDAMIDRLLGTSAYGVNQARFWLDLVRYADTDGYRADHRRPEARHYRDYVIQSFNDDKPYDRFVMEQLAGDEIDPGNRDAIIATMYLRHWIYEHNQRDVEGQWQEILCDITNTTADVFLAQGFKCCRCHDHKFDPLLQKDYYRLQSFFAAVQPVEDQPVADTQKRTTWLKKQRAWEAATDDLRRRLHEIESPVLLQHADREGASKFVDRIRNMIEKRPQERAPYERQIASLATRQFDVHPEKLPEWLDAATEATRQQLRTQLAQFDAMKPKPLPTQKFVVADVGPVAPVTLIPEIEPQAPIAPGFPTILDPAPATIIPPAPALQSTGRRTALAKWIASPQNPLTARVIVNRIWQQHFGRGLVATASDFGHLGEPPSHPQLLDWLAHRFIKDGWSLKKLHRLILTSATWQQSSLRRADHRLRALDPQNRLLWRMNARRLSGEEVMDSLLAASGELDEKNRAIYKPVKRNQPDPLLQLFDFPDRIRSTALRHRTTSAPQALMLLNNAWSQERAEKMAQRFTDTSAAELTRRLYATLFSRAPSAAETTAALEFLASYRNVSAGGPDISDETSKPPDAAARIALVHALMNASEFIYID